MFTSLREDSGLAAYSDLYEGPQAEMQHYKFFG